MVRTCQLRVAAAPAVDSYMDSGRDETGFADLDDVLGALRRPESPGRCARRPRLRGRLPGFPHATETVRDVLDIAVRSPWGWPQWNVGDPEDEDVRAATVGQLSVVHVIDRLTRHLAVLDIDWIGQQLVRGLDHPH
ncbi:hypothetical protein SATRM34S_06944 [Streptomyces atroolivaceus]